jgi:hypothetical protein
VRGAAPKSRTYRDRYTVALVGLFGGVESGTLAQGPEAAAVHRRVNSAREGKLAREREHSTRSVVATGMAGGLDSGW